MSEPFLAEIRIMSFNYAPRGWAQCNGQILPINQNQALFALMGTMYGGNGQTTFALPNLQGRVPIHQGGGHTISESAGRTSETITQQTMPAHLHALQASANTNNANIPDNTMLLGSSAPNDLYTGFNAPVALSPTSVTSVGGSQAHNNMMPYGVLNFCIALQGIFPSQN